MQAEQRDALAGLLDIKPVRLAQQIEMKIAAGDRLEARSSGGLLTYGFFARRGDHVLEIQQVGHERMQVAFDAHELCLTSANRSGEAGRRQRLPEFFPNALPGARRLKL